MNFMSLTTLPTFKVFCFLMNVIPPLCNNMQIESSVTNGFGKNVPLSTDQSESVQIWCRLYFYTGDKLSCMNQQDFILKISWINPTRQHQEECSNRDMNTAVPLFGFETCGDTWWQMKDNEDCASPVSPVAVAFPTCSALWGSGSCSPSSGRSAWVSASPAVSCTSAQWRQLLELSYPCRILTLQSWFFSPSCFPSLVCHSL